MRQHKWVQEQMKPLHVKEGNNGKTKTYCVELFCTYSI